MNLYKVIIKSSGDGWTDENTCKGVVIDTGGLLVIDYKMDGDDCVLTYDGKRATQSRTGAQNISIAFEEGIKTFCEIKNGAFSGSFDILTRSLKFISGAGGYKLTIEYLSGEELIKINFNAVKQTSELYF